jgi:hypothetical protein
LVHEGKKNLTQKVLPVALDYLTKYDVERQPELLERDTQYPRPVECLTEDDEGLVIFQLERSLFLASDEDLDKAIRRTLRHFHQKVLQRSYFG